MNGINNTAGISLPVAEPSMVDLIDACSRRNRFWVDETRVAPMAGHPAAERVARVGAATAAARASQRFPVQIRKLRKR